MNIPKIYEEEFSKLCSEKGGEMFAMKYLIQLHLEVLNKKKPGPASTVSFKIDEACKQLPLLFEAQKKIPFVIGASLLSDVFFNSQFIHGKHLYERMKPQIEASNISMQTYWGVDISDSKKANGQIKSESIKSGKPQGEYLRELAGII